MRNLKCFGSGSVKLSKQNDHRKCRFINTMEQKNKKNPQIDTSQRLLSANYSIAEMINYWIEETKIVIA